MRRNKAIVEELARFANDVHGYMMSGGAVTVRRSRRGPRGRRPSRAAAASTGRRRLDGAAGTSTTKTY